MVYPNPKFSVFVAHMLHGYLRHLLHRSMLKTKIHCSCESSWCAVRYNCKSVFSDENSGNACVKFLGRVLHR